MTPHPRGFLPEDCGEIPDVGREEGAAVVPRFGCEPHLDKGLRRLTIPAPVENALSANAGSQVKAEHCSALLPSHPVSQRSRESSGMTVEGVPGQGGIESQGEEKSVCLVEGLVRRQNKLLCFPVKGSARPEGRPVRAEAIDRCHSLVVPD